MTFHSGSWQQRFGAMGDEAESIFEEVHPWGWTRYGLRRPGIQVAKLPMKLRYTPDYLTSSSLVEVMGFGTDGVLKLKTEKLLALHLWLQDMPTQLFLWDSHRRRYAYGDVAPLTKTIHATSTVKSFNDGKTYWAVPSDELDLEWMSK